MPNARSTEVDPLGVINLIGSNLMDRYSTRSILKELLQNADDAGARTVLVGWTPSPGGHTSHQLLQGPALFVVNDGTFTARDADAINRFGQLRRMVTAQASQAVNSEHLIWTCTIITLGP
jgi:hypothetical protein